MLITCILGNERNPANWRLHFSRGRRGRIVRSKRYNDIRRLRLHYGSWLKVPRVATRLPLRLSPRRLISKHVTSEKLSPNHYDKTNYVVHCENLRFYLKHGLQLVKVHIILKFRQSEWIKPYIDFNTAKRRAAKSSFLQSHYKNLNNMLFGKTMESRRKRMNLELVTNQTRAKKLIAKPTTLHWDIIIENLVSVI